MNKTLIAVLASLGIAALIYYFAMRKSDGEGDDALGAFNGSGGQSVAPPPPPPPSTGGGNNNTGGGLSNTGGGGVATAPVTLYDTETGIGADQIEKRVKVLYKDRDELHRAIDESGVLDNLFSGLSYGSSMRLYLNQHFGGLLNIPIIPPGVDRGGFTSQMDILAELPTFNDLERGDRWAQAESTYKGAATLADGRTFWNTELIRQMAIENEQFGSHTRPDRNRSNNVQNFAEDLKRLAPKLANGAVKVEKQLREQAITDLRGIGWKFSGYDVA